MIESRLDARIDGIGGGPHDGDLTVAQVAEEFRYLAAEGRARSVSAVLRFVKEQAKGRASYVGYPLLVGALALFCGLLVGLALVDPHRKTLGTMIGMGSIVLAPLGAHALLTRERRGRSQSQLDELRRLALETLGVIVARQGFAPKPLDKEQRKLFASLRQTDPEGWLQVAKALAEEPA